MSNYKLTTNLIADCMALIPHNLEVLNDNYDFFASGDMDVEYYFNELHPRLKFLNLSHCLRTILDFKFEIKGDVIIDNIHFFEGDLILHSEPDRCTNLLVIFDPNLKKYRLLNMDNEFIWDVEGVNTHWGKWVVDLSEVELEKCGTKPRTIASATLHGQGEYPPSTLEELCESYKNVMKK